MKLKGFEEFKKILEDIKKKSPQQLGKFLTKQAMKLEREVKENTPVDTGILRSGWQRETESKTFERVIYNDVEYVNHVEYGHRIKKKEKKNKKKFIPGKYMLHNAVRKIEDEFYSDLDKKFGDVIKKWNS